MSETAQQYCEAPRKRQKIEEIDESEDDNIKRAKYDWYFTLESESPVPTDEDDESIYSVQGKETDFARDTSDTSTNVWSESDVSIHKEFEVDSRSENDSSFVRISSSSEPENTVAVEFITFYDSEGLADDSDTSKSSADNEMKNGNFLTCVQCNNPNNNPLYRYCQKCYQIRKSTFSRNRPRRKSRAPIVIGDEDKKSPNACNTSAELTVLVEDLSRTDSGLPSSQDTLLDRSASSIIAEGIGRIPGACVERLMTMSSSGRGGSSMSLPDDDDEEEEGGPVTPTALLCASSSLGLELRRSRSREILLDLSSRRADLGGCPSSPESDTSELNRTRRQSRETELRSILVDGLSPIRQFAPNKQLFSEEGGEVSDASVPNSDVDISQNQTQISDKMCLICTVQPKNGAFMHGTNMHICCCYRCAVKVCRTNNNRCPICNRKVTQVLKAFYG